MGVLIGEALTPLPTLADNTVPNSYGGTPSGTGSTKNDPNTFNSRGSMALGFAASAGYDTDNLGNKHGTNNGSSIAIGTLSLIHI